MNTVGRDKKSEQSAGMKKLGICLLAVILVLGGGFAMMMGIMSYSAEQPKSLGVTDGRLQACPNTPNCVSTQSQGDQNKMDPIQWNGSSQEAITRLAEIIAAMPRTVIVAQTDDYLHAEFTSGLFRFVDDVEFYVDSARYEIQFRSASRTGYSDLGVNRKRMTDIVNRFEAQAKP